MEKINDSQTQKIVFIPSIITVGDFAKRLNLPVSQVISELMKNGVMATINENIDFETAAIIGEYLGFQIEPEKEKSATPQKETVSKKNLLPRPPVVVVMGHVDHGKTSLLDAIRESNIVAQEAGGITQHIGAYQAGKNNQLITFLDTPGHEAFTQMRAHGAKVTDIGIIVIAADDGIKPQTLEAIDHAKKYNLSVIFAITKIDKPEANIDFVKRQLMEIGIVPEELGGKDIITAVSAKTKEGLDDLLDLTLILAETLDLKADPSVPATGVVIESHLDYGKGPIATILVQNGTLHLGDWVAVGETYGKIKSMEDFRGKKLKEALPSTPIKIAGLKELSNVSDILMVFQDEKTTKEEVANIKKLQHAKKITQVKKIKTEDILEAVAKAKGIKELNIILKTDVQGSLDAIRESLGKISTPEVAVKIVQGGIGDITENDISMAKTSGAIIFGFRVGLKAAIDQLAKRERVKISLYDVIYELLDDIKGALSELLTPEKIEILEGKLEVLKIFKTGKPPVIVGGKVIEGKMKVNSLSRILRKKEVIGEGKIVSVKREKEEVGEAVSGTECGLGLDIKFIPQEKDIVEAFQIEERKRTL